MSKNNSKITLLDESGKEHEFDVFFTFDSDETGKSYMVYTDHQKDKNGKEKVYASVYDPSGVDKNIYPIETDKEWEIIENILSSIEKKIEEKE